MSSQKDERKEELRKLKSSFDSSFKFGSGQSLFQNINALQNMMQQFLNDPSSIGNLDHQTYFLREMVPGVLFFLKRENLDPAITSDIGNLFHSALQLTLETLDRNLLPLSETLYELFKASYPFYISYGRSNSNQIQNHEDQSQKEEETFLRKLKYMSHCSKFFVANIEAFGSLDGLNKIKTRILDSSSTIPLPHLLNLLKAIARIRNLINVNYVKTFVNDILQRVFDLILATDDEFRTNSKHFMTEVLNNLHYLLAEFSQKPAHIIEPFSMKLALKCFEFSTLEKRVNGLQDIRDFIRNVMGQSDYFKKKASNGGVAPQEYADKAHVYEGMWMNSQILVSWLRDHKILEQLYQTQTFHSQLINRCVDVPRFLAQFDKLTPQDLDLIWSATYDKHETDLHAVYSSISELSSVLDLDQIEYLYKKIQAIPFESYDLQTLQLIRRVAASGVNCQHHLSDDKKKWFGLDLFWELILDSNPVHPDVHLHGLSTLYDFLNWPPCYSQRIPFIFRCLQFIKQNNSVSACLSLCRKILTVFAQQQSVDSVIQNLNTSEPLLPLIFSALREYKLHIKKLIRENQLDPASLDLNTCNEQIRARLEFLEFVLLNSNLELDKPLTLELWKTLVLDVIHPEERDYPLHWFKSLNQQNMSGQAFSSEIGQYIFLELSHDLDFPNLRENEFQFLEFFFRDSNIRESRFYLSGTKEPKKLLTTSFNLIGVDIIYRIALEAKNEEVGTKAISLLNTSFNHVCESLEEKFPEQRVLYLQSWMEHLRSFYQKLDVNPEQSVLAITRCLSLFKLFIEEYEIKFGLGSEKHGAFQDAPQDQELVVKATVIRGGSNNLKLELKMKKTDLVGTLRQEIARESKSEDLGRLVHSGAQLVDDDLTLAEANIHEMVWVVGKKPGPENDQLKKLNLSQLDQPDLLPSRILSKELIFFDLLRVPVLADKAWDLLMLLPTHTQYLAAFTEFPDQVNWATQLPSDSTHLLLYSLQVIYSLIKPQNLDSNWRQRYLNTHLLDYLFDVVMKGDFKSGSKAPECLGLLLKVINTMLNPSFDDSQDKISPAAPEFISKVPTGFIPHLSSIILAASKGPGDTTMSPQLFVGLIANASALLISICLGSSSHYLEFFKQPDVDSWIEQTVIYSPLTPGRNSMTVGLFQMCKEDNPIMIDNEHPQTSLLRRLLSFLKNIKPETSTSKQYFTLLCSIARLQPNFNYNDVFEFLVSKVKKDHPMMEQTSWDTPDYVLIGYMNLLSLLIDTNKEFAKNSFNLHLLPEVFDSLFDLPTIDSRRQGAQNEPPKCKTEEARKAAFSLCITLALNNSFNFSQLVSLLLKQNDPNQTIALWNYLPSTNERARTGYVGLRNLGATCYMNSLIQQLFMIRGFRYELLNAPISSVVSQSIINNPQVEKKDQEKLIQKNLQEDVFFQLQQIMARLQESKRKFYDTVSFCKCYTYEGKPVNPMVQMDAEEFLSMLFDKLEMTAKKHSLPEATLTQKYFSGKLCNQIISKECKHVSETEEGFFNLGLAIKGKKNIIEALELFIEGDPLEGENKYDCSQCQKKVDAKKRACLQDLPDNLIVTNKRFEFDLDYLSRLKLNDYIEFPHELDLKKYTKEYLEFKEGRGAESAIREDAYYQYNLVGIVCHMGSAEVGHYYSFIRDRVTGKWFEFNDIRVDDFSTSSIPQKCFGGWETVNQWDNNQKKYVSQVVQKSDNAYLLFYERGKTQKATPEQPVTNPASVVPQDLFEQIWKDNLVFMKEKQIFHRTYFDFIWRLVSSFFKNRTFDPVLDYSQPLDRGCPRVQLIMLFSRFLFVTLSHAKENEGVTEYVRFLKELLTTHIPVCKWFLETAIQHKWIRILLLQCPNQPTREAVIDLFNHLIRLLVPHERSQYQLTVETESKDDKMEIVNPPPSPPNAPPTPPKPQEGPLQAKIKLRPVSLVLQFQLEAIEFIKQAGYYWQNFAEFFLIFQDFAAQGEDERRFFADHNVVARLIDFYLGDDSPQAPPKVKRPKLSGDNKNNPDLTHMLNLIADMVEATGKREFSFSTLDQELLECPKFYERMIRENAGKPSVHRIVQNQMTNNPKITAWAIGAVTDAMDSVDSTALKPYFEFLKAILSHQDNYSQQRAHDGLTRLMKIIQENLNHPFWIFSATQWINALLMPLNNVSDWMLRHLSWMEMLLLHNSQATRAEVVEIVEKYFLPDYPRKVSDFLPNNTLPPSDDTLQSRASPRTCQTASHLHRYLLEWLGTVAQIEFGDHLVAHKTFDADNFRLIEFFQLLKLFASVQPDAVSLFIETFPNFIDLFQILNESEVACDLNRKEILEYWNMFLHEEKVLSCMLANNYVSDHMMAFHISVDAHESYTSYNNHTLPIFYKIILLLSKANPVFLKKVRTHDNLFWALDHIYLENPFYPNITPIFLEILHLCSSSSVWRHNLIPRATNRLLNNPSNVIKLLQRILLVDNEDALVFCNHQGLSLLSFWIRSQSLSHRDASLVANAISLLNLSLEACLSNPNEAEILQKWDQKEFCVKDIVKLFLDTEPIFHPLCAEFFKKMILADSSMTPNIMLPVIEHFNHSNLQPSFLQAVSTFKDFQSSHPDFGNFIQKIQNLLQQFQ